MEQQVLTKFSALPDKMKLGVMGLAGVGALSLVLLVLYLILSALRAAVSSVVSMITGTQNFTLVQGDYPESVTSSHSRIPGSLPFPGVDAEVVSM